MNARRPEPLDRRQFDALTSEDRLAHIRAGGSVFDAPPPESVTVPTFLARDVFDRLPEVGKREILRRGVQIFDSGLKAPATMSISRKQFDLMPAEQRTWFTERGGTIAEEGRSDA